jgi:hypothetical protein
MSWLQHIDLMSFLTFVVGLPLLLMAVGVVGLGRKGFLKFMAWSLVSLIVILLIGWLISILWEPVWHLAKVGLAKVPYNESAIIAMAQIEGVLAGIAIPLGLEMISKVADRYSSTAVNTYFKQKSLIRYFPAFMLGLVSVTLLPVAFLPEDSKAPIFVIAASVLFGLGVWASERFLNLLRSYTGSGYLLEELNKRAEKIVK